MHVAKGTNPTSKTIHRSTHLKDVLVPKTRRRHLHKKSNVTCCSSQQEDCIPWGDTILHLGLLPPCPCPRTPCQPPGLPPPSPCPRTPRQSPWSISPCPSDTVAGPVSSSPQPCRAQPWTHDLSSSPGEVPDAQGCPGAPRLPGSCLGVGRAMATRPCHHPPWDSLGSRPPQGPGIQG